MKKSLIFWFAAVTCAALFLVGCESPTNGESGAAGTDGPYPLTGTTIDADDLKAAFYVSSRVAITDGSSGIDGEVPAGKTLYVLGSAAKVASGESLTVKGTLDIYEAAALNASYVSGGSGAGYLATDGGAITGTGIVSLPYLAAGVTDGPTGIVTYGNSPGGITKTAGSYIAVSAADPGSALDTGDLSAIFGVVGELTVGSLTTPLVATAIPANKTLTVNGAASIGATLDLTGKGALVIGKTGTLTVSGDYNITGNATAGIVIEGTLSVGGGVTVNKVDLSNANVTNSEAKTLTLTKGASAVVIGKITPVASNALTIAGSDSGTTVYIKEIAGVSGSAAVTFGANSVLAIPQDESLTIGEGSSISVTNANYALSTANLAKLKGKVTYTGSVTGTADALVVPVGVELDAGTGTLENITGLTVNGTLTASSATLAAATAINIGNGGILDIDNNSAFTTAQGSLVITSTGTGKIVSETTTPAVLQALLGKAGATLNIEQGDAVTLSAAATVKAGTVLTLVESGSVTTATSNFDLTVKGKVIAGDVTIDGLNGVSGITTTYAAGVTVSYANGLSFGVNDKITIPAGGANVNVGGPNGITLGAGTYKATSGTITIKLDTSRPTLTGTSANFLVGADTTDGGLLTIGSGSVVSKSTATAITTANTEQSPADTKLAVYIAPGATITNTTGNDSGITLDGGAIDSRTTGTIPGVSNEVGLQLLGSSATDSKWIVGSPAGVGN